MLGGGQAGLLVEPKDTAALTEAIRRLMRSPEQRRALGVAARARVVAEFTQARLVKAIYYLYQGIPADDPATTLT
jgi:rhamnosyl/mannosyltransferase